MGRSPTEKPAKLDNGKAQARLEELRARLDKAVKEEREKIRLELLRLQYEAPGTGAALGAARLVMRFMASNALVMTAPLKLVCRIMFPVAS